MKKKKKLTYTCFQAEFEIILSLKFAQKSNNSLFIYNYI